MDKFVVLRLRHDFKRKELLKMTGRDLLVHAVDQGWISRSTMENAEIGEVRLDASGFRAAVSLKQAPDTPLFVFVQEQGMWRIALSRTFGIVNQWFKNMVATSGLSEEEFAITTIESISRYKVDRRILDGPLD
jgi:hypothetical protein